MAGFLSRLPPDAREEFLSNLTEQEAEQALYTWPLWARPNQLVPHTTHWITFLALSGRGFGKTRLGAEETRWRVEEAGVMRVHLVARTQADVRDTMVEGESGLIAVSPPWFKPKYESSKRRVVWPNGAYALMFSAEQYDQLRGPQCEFLWADEVASWQYPDETWANAMFGLRLGKNPQAVATSTPRPIKLIRELLNSPDTVVVRGSSYENRDNLAPAFFKQIIRKYEGTRLGRQEIYGEVLDDNPNALWTRERIDLLRVVHIPDLIRIVVAVDPPALDDSMYDYDEDRAAECGIVVVGKGLNDHIYILADLSLAGSPRTWATQAVAAFYQFQADRIIAEINNGGAMVEHTIRSVDGGKTVPYKIVTATRGKMIRAEPVSALYEQGKVHHVGTFADMEDQMCTWEPGMKSPDRMDALVWGVSELAFNDKSKIVLRVH